MKNLLIVLFFCFGLVSLGTAQTGQVMVRNDGKGLYIQHAVAAKEGLYSVARLYKVHPKFLASFNNMDMNSGLNIGQVLRIPLTDTNFSQNAKKGTPVYYKVGEKEGLMKVSTANNKVKLQSLREWNKITKDNITPGSNLIVGFLTTGGNPVTTAPAAPKDDPKKISTEKTAVKTETPKDKPVVKTDPGTVKQTTTETRRDTSTAKPVVKEEAKKIPADSPKNDLSPAAAQGYFKSSFDEQVKQVPASKMETVTSGIFKTNFGLQDAKYYMLIDGVAPGTIIRIINPENNKLIYAKVLGEMNGIRQNKGLDIRLGESAATTLGITDTEKFIVKINY